jgi:hypothetical protein
MALRTRHSPTYPNITRRPCMRTVEAHRELQAENRSTSVLDDDLVVPRIAEVVLEDEPTFVRSAWRAVTDFSSMSASGNSSWFIP